MTNTSPQPSDLSSSFVPRVRLAGHVLGQLTVLVFAGALMGFLFGIFQSQSRWIDGFNGAVIALASATVGGLLGLLFGVPRSLAGLPSSTVVPRTAQRPRQP